jgi:hypothetical protein
LPLDDAYDRLRQQFGSGDPALSNLREAFRSGAVRTKKRELRGDADGELLQPAFWKDQEIQPWNNRIWLVSEAMPWVRPSFLIYVWEPDFKKFFGVELAVTTETEKPAKTSTEMGRPPVHNWVEITTEIAWRCYREKKPPGKGRREKFADEIATWCIRRFKKAPDEKALLKVIAVVMRRLD